MHGRNGPWQGNLSLKRASFLTCLLQDGKVSFAEFVLRWKISWRCLHEDIYLSGQYLWVASTYLISHLKQTFVALTHSLHCNKTVFYRPDQANTMTVKWFKRRFIWTFYSEWNIYASEYLCIGTNYIQTIRVPPIPASINFWCHPWLWYCIYMTLILTRDCCWQ